MTIVTYEFRYFNALSSIPVVERLAFGSDGEARIRGVSELLRLPHRAAVEVWRGVVLIYAHRRRGYNLNTSPPEGLGHGEPEGGIEAPGDGGLDDGLQ